MLLGVCISLDHKVAGTTLVDVPFVPSKKSGVRTMTPFPPVYVALPSVLSRIWSLRVRDKDVWHLVCEHTSSEISHDASDMNAYVFINNHS